jgi:putative FmdB family regulatory protein
MPLYEYRCDKCGKTFEVIQKFSDAPLEVHEDCGGHVERLLSAPALQFKGSGWYITDYAKSGGSKRSDSGKSESKSEGSSSESKSESKSSDSKSDSKPSTPAPASKSD